MTELSRRDFLRAAAGAAALACAPSRPALLGSFVERARPRGHAWRDGLRPSPGRTSQWDVVIVGAGVAGLTAAWRLRGAGVDKVCVLELESRPGGSAASGQNAVSAHPWGAHYIPVPSPHCPALLRFLEEAGVGRRGADGRFVPDEAQLCRDPQERLFIADRFYEGLYPSLGASAADQADWRRFEAEMDDWASRRDAQGRPFFAIPMAYGSDDEAVRALDRLSMRAWLLDRGYTSTRLHWLVDYACRDDFGATAADTSAWAGVHYWASRRGHDEGDLFTWPEGNGHLVQVLTAPLGAALRLGELVSEVRHTAGGVQITSTAADGSCEALRAKVVIVAVPQRFGARLLGNAARIETAQAFEMSPWLVANLTLRQPPTSRGFPLAWDNVLKDGRGLGYVVATHQRDRTPPGRSVWTYYLPVADLAPAAARAWLEGLDWASAAELVLADLQRAHPDLRDCVEQLDVWRWGHGMIRPRPGFVFGGERERASKSEGPVHFAHSDLSGLALFEEALYRGVGAAEATLVTLGRGAASWL